MTRINTNVSSLVAQRVLNKNNNALNLSLQRLSTGLKINSGADNPAGLIASENLRAEKAGISTAIDTVLQAARRHSVDVSVCGEMSGDPIYTMLLVGMGLRQLSVTPHNIPEIKKVIRSITVEEATKVAQEALRLETARDVNNYLREQTRK